MEFFSLSLFLSFLAYKRLVAAQEKRIRNLQDSNENTKKEFSSQLTTYTRLLQQANQRFVK